MDIQTPLSPHSSPSGPNVIFEGPLPRPPCAPSHRKISQFPEQTPPNVGGSPQSQALSHPSFSNHAKLCWISDTLSIGVSRCAFIAVSPQSGQNTAFRFLADLLDSLGSQQSRGVHRERSSGRQPCGKRSYRDDDYHRREEHDQAGRIEHSSLALN